MSVRTTTWLAWSSCGAALVLLVAAMVLISLGWASPLPGEFEPWRDQAVEALGFVGAPILGGIIASLRPRNPYGWLWLGFGLCMSFVTFAGSYASYSAANPGTLPAASVVVMVSGMGWVAGVSIVPFLLLLFPSGQLPSRRWRVLGWVVVMAGALALMLLPFLPLGEFAPVENPLAVSGAIGRAIATLTNAAIQVILVAIVFSALSLVLRFRRAAGVERQQIKWFAYAAAVNGVSIMMDFLGLDRLLGDALWTLLGALGFAALYLAVGIAILKYRLYDIDIIINRTLVYGSLTATLAMVYVGGVIFLQYVFHFITGSESQFAIVASTLVIAALFNPLRRRIQAFIDRVFYRKKYDVTKTLAAFSKKVRDETDLEALNAEVILVVRETMQPEHISVWLRTVNHEVER